MCLSRTKQMTWLKGKRLAKGNLCILFSCQSEDWGLKGNKTLFFYASLLGPVIRCLLFLAIKALSCRVNNKFKNFFVNTLFILSLTQK